MKQMIINVIKLIGLMLLSQIPMTIMGIFILTNEQASISFTVIQAIIVLLLLVAAIVVFLIWTKKSKLAEWKIQFVWENIGKILGGFGVLFLIAIVGGILMQLSDKDTTVNQAALDGISRAVPPIVMYALAGVGAPIMEEVVFRMGIRELLFPGMPKIALFVSSFLFAFVHTPTNFASWFIYLGMGLVFGFVYMKTRKIEVPVFLHFLWNTLAVLMMFAGM